MTEDDDVDMDSSNKLHTFYNGATPWSPPQNEDESIFHEPVKQVGAPLVRSFTGTLEIGFSIGSAVNVDVSVMLKLFLSYVQKTDPNFRILPLKGGNQSIFYSNGIPTTKEGIDLYFQSKIGKDGVGCKITVTMSRSIGQVKDMGSTF
jgi:hypothetical protein